MPARVLIVEDDPPIAELLSYHLEKEGFQVTRAADGRAALEAFNAVQPELILLDLMLPGLDGIEVCRRIRRVSDVPVIMLTAKGQEEDRLEGFAAGADDYVTKPFSPRELLARVHAVMRRAPRKANRTEIVVDDLVFDRNRRKVLKAGRELDLTPKEFDLLDILLSRRGEPISREILLEEVWGYEAAGGTRTVDVHIRRLRQKLNDDPQRPRFIETVHGIGYRFKEDMEASGERASMGGR